MVYGIFILNILAMILVGKDFILTERLAFAELYFILLSRILFSLFVRSFTNSKYLLLVFSSG